MLGERDRVTSSVVQFRRGVLPIFTGTLRGKNKSWEASRTVTACAMCLAIPMCTHSPGFSRGSCGQALAVASGQCCSLQAVWPTAHQRAPGGWSSLLRGWQVFIRLYAAAESIPDRLLDKTLAQDTGSLQPRRCLGSLEPRVLAALVYWLNSVQTSPSWQALAQFGRGGNRVPWPISCRSSMCTVAGQSKCKTQCFPHLPPWQFGASHQMLLPWKSPCGQGSHYWGQCPG